MIKKIVLVLVVLVAAVLVAASFQPDTFAVQRSIVINAPAGKIYPHIVDLHAWAGWSPWEKLDPAMKRTFTGPDAGKGAAYEWEGNNNVGAGRMEITEATAPAHVTIALHFIKPMDGHSVAQLALDPAGDTTRVTWSMTGPMAFVSKVMCLFMSMDKMIGGDFEKGLANLKALAEAAPAKP